MGKIVEQRVASEALAKKIFILSVIGCSSFMFSVIFFIL